VKYYKYDEIFTEAMNVAVDILCTEPIHNLFRTLKNDIKSEFTLKDICLIAARASWNYVSINKDYIYKK
jgi:hypothetical protein